MELCGEFYAYRLFPLLDLQYPGSCFIYNTRDVSRWVDSRMNHRKGKYARAYLDRMRRAFDDPSLTLEDLRQHRDDALTAWERLLAAEVIHNLNLTLADLDALGTPDHVFEEQAQHWSQMKGFALGFQFSRHSALNDAQFLELHSLIGQQPVIDATDAAAVRTYRDDLLDARALLAFAFAFDAADVEAW